eukprot:scaffold555_cov109-Isochrysis_galbana.AAC.15
MYCKHSEKQWFLPGHRPGHVSTIRRYDGSGSSMPWKPRPTWHSPSPRSIHSGCALGAKNDFDGNSTPTRQP